MSLAIVVAMAQVAKAQREGRRGAGGGGLRRFGRFGGPAGRRSDEVQTALKLYRRAEGQDRRNQR